MKATVYRIVTILLMVALIATLAFSVFAVNKTTGTQDGLYAIFTTDKQEYTADEEVKVNLQLVNNANANAEVNLLIQMPSCMQVSSGSASQSVTVDAAAMWDAEEVTLTYNGAAEEGSLAWIWWVVAGVVVIAGAVLLLIYGKNLKSHVSILLMIAMMLSFVTMAMPVSAEGEQKSFDLVNKIKVDGNEVELTATISYTLGEAVIDDEEIDDGRLVAFYFNDCEDPDRWIQDGATLNYGENLIDSAVEENGNHYGYIEAANTTNTAYFQADFKNPRAVEHMVIRIDLSTKDKVAKGTYLTYRYTSSKQYKLFTVAEDGHLNIAGQDFPNVVVEKGKWLQLEFVVDFTNKDKDTAEVYANDKKLAVVDLPKTADNYAIRYMRLYMPKQAEVGRSIWFDNFAVYESDVRLPLDQIKSPKIPHGERRTIAPDVEMIHPEISDLGKDAVAFLVGSKAAYAGEKLITMSAAAQAVTSNNELVDIKVPGSVLKQYLGASGLDDNTLYSVKEYANNKNVHIDKRGVVIVSEKKLDATADIKLVTMVYGYLKTGNLVNNYAVAPTFSQTVIDEAFITPNPTFGSYASYTGSLDVRPANVLYYLILVARMDETAKSSDGRSVKDEAIRRLRHLIDGGNEPNCQPGHYWFQAVIGNCLVLAKSTPSIWNSLTAEEKGKMDLLMECLAISSNFAHNALNDYKAGFDMRGNFMKSYGNNFKSASFTNYLNAVLYFGSAEKVDEIYMNFSHADYVKRLEKAGFTNILAIWTVEDLFGVSIGTYMDLGGDMYYKLNKYTSKFPQGGFAGTGVGVKAPWSYVNLKNKHVYSSDDFYPMLLNWFGEIYRWAVISSYGVPGEMTYAYISTGKQSPYQGQMGMLLEFASDSEGRSKCDYSLLSAMVIMGFYSNMKLLGKWDYDAQTPEIAQTMRYMDSRLNVGNMDLFFKLGEGYYGNSQKKQTFESLETLYGRGVFVLQDIWYNFNNMDNQLVEIFKEEVIPELEPAATPMNGVTKPPEGAVIAQNKDHHGSFIDPRIQHVIDGKCYSEGTLEFDVAIGDLEVDDFNGVLLWGQQHAGDSTYGDYGMAVSFNSGNIMVYDKNNGDYVATGVRFGANYRFHFKVDFNCKTARYDLTVTQTWPKTDKPVVGTVKNLWFRDSDNYVDCIVPVNYNNFYKFWLENIEISGKTRAKTTYTPFAELNVSIDWSDVPASERPSTVKAYLVFNGNKHPHKYVTLKASDGWKAKSFDHLPKEIGIKEVVYDIYVEPQPGYATIISQKDKKNTIKITASKKPVIYDNDFQSGELGILEDTSTSDKTYFATEGSNKFLAMDNKDKLSQQLKLAVDGMYMDGKLNSLYSVMFFEMDLRKVSKDSVVSGYALGYRKDRTDGKEGTSPHYLIRLAKNVVKVETGSKTYTIGQLTDDWQTLKVCYDIANRRALISYGSDTNYILVEDLPENRAGAFWAWTQKNYSGLALDNMKVYCDNTKSVQSVLESMTIDLKVNMAWGSDVPAKDIPASVKAYLVVNGEVTDKYVTLKKSDNWKAKTFKDLKVLVNGEKQEYSLKPEYLYNVHTYTEQVGNDATITVCTKYTYYDNDFSSAKVEVVDKIAQVLDKNGNVLKVNAGETAIAGSNPYLVFNNVTATISNSAMKEARNVIFKLRLKSDKFEVGGNFVASYVAGKKENGGNVYANIIEVENVKGTVSFSFLGKKVGVVTEGEWINLEVRVDFENNVCMAKLNDGDWQYVYDCPQRTSNMLRFYSNKVMTWQVDDLKVYTDATWSTGETAKTTDINANVNWEGAPALDSVRVQLYCNGVAVSGKTLTLNAANNWSGVFKKLPTRDTIGTKQVYTVKALDTASGYKLYTTGNGYTINFTKMDYYYWNDFAGMSMTDANGVVPLIAPSVSYDTTDNVFAKYQGTLNLRNDAIKTAKNVMIGMKLKMDTPVSRASFMTRYRNAENAYVNLFKAEVNKAATTITLYLAGTKVGTMEAGKWYDFVIAYDQQKHNICLYVDGTLIGKPVAIDPNASNLINFYSGSTWDVDDLRVYTDPAWDWLGELRTYADKTVSVNWDGAAPALENVTVQLYANGNAVDGKTLTLNAGNSWTGIFEDLPSHNDNGDELTYTVALVESLPGYNTYLTGNGLTINCVKDTYYYWNDFAGSSMTDANGVAPNTFVGSASYEGTDDLYAKYQGTFLLSNDAIKTAKNVMVGMKLKLDTMVPYAYIQARYKTADNAKYQIFRAEVNKAGNTISLYLAGTKVGTMEAGKWYDFVIGYDQLRHELSLYVDGTLVGGPVAVDPNAGSAITIYASNGTAWDLDDLRIYTDSDWTTVPQETVDVTVNIAWQDNENALNYRPAEQVTAKLYADGEFVKDEIIYANGGWTATIQDLPKLNSTTGNEIVYTVTVAADNYLPSYNGTDVTMKLYLPDAVVSKSVEIVWDDANNVLGHRPAEEVTVQLYADGVPTGEPVKVKLADGWKYTFENLPQYNLTTCTEIVYTVKIENVDYYIASYQGDQIVMSRFVKLTSAVVTVETPFAD